MIPTVTDHTPNIWDTGSDDLERLALEECIKRQRLDHRVSVLLLPFTSIDLPRRFAQLGAQVICSAPKVRSREIKGRILAAGLKEEVRLVEAEFPDLPDTDGEPYDIIYIRQGLCHLPYATAKELLRGLLRRLRIGGRIYVSILGLHSELGVGYADENAPVSQRFAELSPDMVERYGVEGEICLYTERDLFMLLMESGASVLRTFTTTYGNVRGVGVRV